MALVVENPALLFKGATGAFARNDALANGPWTRNAIARQLNHLLSRQLQILPGKQVSSPRNTATAARLWTTRYRASPNGTTLVVTVRLAKTATAAGSPRWWIVLDSVAQDDQFHNVRCAAGAGRTFDDIFEMRQEITVTAGAKHTIELWTDDNCQIMSWSLHEKPRASLVVGTDTVADYTYALPLSPIYYQTMASLRVAADAVWQKMRGAHLSWATDDPATPIAVSSTVAADLWGDALVGPTAPTQYRNSYANENLLGGVATKTIATVCWAYMERTAGAGNVIARFIGGNHAGGVDVTCNSTINMYESTSFTLLPAAAGDQIKVQYLVSAGGTTGNIYAVGCFPLIGS